MRNFTEVRTYAEEFRFLVEVQQIGRRISFISKTLRVFKKLVFCINRQKMRVKVAFFFYIGLL